MEPKGFIKFVMDNHPDPDTLGGKSVYDALPELEALAEHYANNTLKKNILIAEFMGLKKDEINTRYLIHDLPHIRACGWVEPKYLQYHSSWDWIMTVVDRIVVVSLDSNIPNINGIALKMVCESPITIDIGTLHKKCVQFIEWYNEQR